jgi:hypothetical protein
MKPVIVPIAMVLALAAAPARAGVNLSINIGLPVAPPLVAVAPDVMVVEGFRDEVFFYGGAYWCRRPDGWYWAHSPRERFAYVDMRRVPPPLMRERVGYYRDWHPHGARYEGRGPMPGRGPGWGPDRGRGRGPGRGFEDHGGGPRRWDGHHR